MKTFLRSRQPRASLASLLLPFLLSFTSLLADGPPPSLHETFAPYFPVGTAINRSQVTGTAGRRSAEQVAQDIALVKRQFNQVTAENDMKWQLIHPREGSEGYDFGPADAFVNFGQSNRMMVVGHTLVWHSQTPNWVFAGTNPPPPAPSAPIPAAGGTNVVSTNIPGRFGNGFGRYQGPRASREELLQRMRDHIHTVVGRYKEKVQVWDVVNEALADGNGTNVLRNSLWLEIIGPDYIAKAFQFAHEADPRATLRYNDYGLENPAKRRRLIQLIRELQQQQVPVHAIGSQAHLNVSTTFAIMDDALTEMRALGLPIHITELDVNTAQAGQRATGADVAANAATIEGGQVQEADRKLSDAYAAVFHAFLKHRDQVKLVTFWGVNDAVSWRSNGRPLLFDGNDLPKPAFDAVIAEAQKAAGAK
jgi:endo-1,4-beta-xylanase